MTIDEMKNKISMELRSTDTQLGFEVICKKLTDLEKENAELNAEIKQIIEREKVVPEHYLCEMIDKNKELKAQIESLLKYAKDKGIIKSWFYNGSYSWELAE